jgi:C-terminal processing protease CtpA/Prc
MSGKVYNKTIMLTVGDEPSGTEKLAGIGFEIRDEEGKIFIDNVVFGSAAEKSGVDFDQEILNIQVPNHRLPPELMYIPAVALYALIWIIQFRRRKKQQPATVAV